MVDQRLADSGERPAALIAAYEVMVATTAVRNLIKEGKTDPPAQLAG